MCGWVGFLDPRHPQPDDALRTLVARMAATLAHRGPDGSGAWSDARLGLALGFRRLAVVDLTPAGDQPMSSASGRHVLVLNGEVYNAPALRRRLEAEGRAPAFRGHSDTEVALAAIEAWGLETAVARFVGMFAFALWDARERRLCLVRDRIGVKPLYYGHAGGALLFGSELKALRAHPAFDGTIDRAALAAFLGASYVPSPLSIHQGIRKLAPGTIATFDGCTGRELAQTRYWSAHDVAAHGVRHRFRGSAEDAVDEVDRLLRESIALRRVADVPVGVFLSGGVDSSLVSAIMRSQAGRVRTFAIGVADADHDESHHARAVARHLGTEHTEVRVGPEDALAVIPRLPQLYDEPFADSSQIPTHLVSTLARQHVTVALSGDGGDELFGGYAHYAQGRRLWNAVGWMPAPVRSGVARALGHLPASPRVAQLAELLDAGPSALVTRQLWRRWRGAECILVDGAEIAAPVGASDAGVHDVAERAMLHDLTTYLPDDLLVKVDRASMGVGLEVREPFLDHRLVELAWSLPPHLKIRGGTTKWPLKRLLARHLPSALVHRPKMGFSIPIGRWLRGPLRDWGEELLDERRLREDGLLVAAAVRQKWDEHQSGRRDWQYHLWDLLMLQAWLRGT